MTFGIVGLGRIGGGLALQAVRKNHLPIGFDISDSLDELRGEGVKITTSLLELVQKIPAPRVIFLYVHAGNTVDEVINELTPLLEPGDILLDGGNSYWGDSITRANRLQLKGLHFLDLGTSGGVSGAQNGACFMLGGPEEAAKIVEPLLRDLAVEEGFVYAGPSGSGHFVKLVHNGIEFGMLQAIGEGLALMEKFDHPLPTAEVLACWRNGSVIRSWLIDLLHQFYQERGSLESVSSHIEDTGEVNWLVSDALRMEVPIPVIAQSVMQLFTSRDESADWARAVSAMRHDFGGHPLGPDPSIASERVTSRVGDIYRPNP